MMRITIATALMCAASASNAGMIAYNDFSELAGLQLNGSAATLNPNDEQVLRLTNDLGQAGSAFLTDTLSLSNQASFSAAFDFRFSNPTGIWDSDGQGADGIVFVVQTVSNTAGGSGGSIGFGGLQNSVGIEFDTWFNRRWSDGGVPYNDIDGNHVGININGNVESLAQAPVGDRMNDGNVWGAWVDYDGVEQSLEVRLSMDGIRPDDALVSLEAMDLASVLGTPDAYVGFTSGTGGAGGTHDILSLNFRDDFDPIVAREASVPVPGSLALLAMGLMGFPFRPRPRPRQRQRQRQKMQSPQ